MAIQTFVSGAVLTAAQMNTLQQQAVMTFTTEAARDAALTSPTEGMFAYITAPTIPAATGSITYIPSGIQTIYNGTVWVCLTAISGFQSATGTTSSATYTATLSGSPGTNVAVTTVTGTTAEITIGANHSINVATNDAIVGVAVSGATTLAASSTQRLSNASTNAVQHSYTYILSGLTAGTNVFTLNYIGGSTATQTVSNRTLTVKGVA